MSHPISARAWNALVRELVRLLSLTISTIRGRAWAHPWTVTPSYNVETQQWQCTVRPGFVNGQDVTVSVNQPSTLNSQPAEIPLTDAPQIPLSATRIIGLDADPVSITASEDSDQPAISYEPVLDFFAAKGVPSVNQPSTNNDELPPRRLRACDLILNHDRPALATVAVGDGLSVGVQVSPNARPHAYLTVSPRFADPASLVPDPIRQLAGDWSDTARDALLLATVYFLSPEDTAADESPNENWTAYVKHEVFWNLCYAHQTQGLQPNANPLTLQTGLAAGAGDALIKSALDGLNAQVSAALDFLANSRLTGRFWTV